MNPPKNASAPAPLTGWQFALGTFAVALATFMNVLDSSIANVAIPTLSGDLGVSVDEGTWVITLFAAANAVAIPLTGWLTQRVGQVKLFVVAILLFVVASAVCGLAPNLPFLLVARVMQGAVAGPMVPLSQALLLGSFPKNKSSSALSLWAMTATVGPIAGPALGGWITDNYSWSWIFYVNVPVGLFAAAVIWALYRKRETPSRKLPVDKVGLMSLIVWVGSLQIMLDKGKDLDWFNSPVIWALTIVALVGFLFFLIWELTEAKPIVDLRLFKGRNFLGGTIAISIGYAIFFANLVILPTWIQEYLGYRGRRCRACDGAARHLRRDPRAGDGQDHAEIGHADIGDARLPLLCGRVPDALVVHDGHRPLHAGSADAAAGYPDGAVLHAAHGHHPVGLAAGEDSGSRGPVELRANLRRRGGHLDHEHHLERPDDPAPCAARRADQRE